MPKLPAKNSLLFFDGLRGLAALYVVTGHARWLLWEGGEKFRENIQDYSVLQRAASVAMSFFKYGHEMVLFFFVLSGFVIHLGNAVKLSQDRPLDFNYGRFLFRRAKRIVPPFAFALLLTFVCDHYVSQSNFSIYNNSLPNKQLNNVIGFDHSATTLLGNVFFLQSIQTPVYGSNGPLWSLAYEWWFYMSYPVLLFLSRKNKWLTVLGLLGFSVLIISGYKTGFALFDHIAGYLFSWWLGAVAADMYSGRINLKGIFYKPLLVVVPCIPYLSYREDWNYLLRDNLTALGFFGLILFLLNNRGGAFVKFLEKIKFTGSFSYTLYVTHFPLLVLMNGLLLSQTNNVLPSSFYFTWLGVALVVCFAFLLHFVLEVPFLASAKPGSKRSVGSIRFQLKKSKSLVQ